MHLIIDCFKLIKGSGKSIGIYNLAKNLVNSLNTSDARPQESYLIVIGNEQNYQDFSGDGIIFVEPPFDPANKLALLYWELWGVKKYLKMFYADRVVFPRGFRPLRYKGKDTVIIHDLIPFYYEEHYPGVLNRWENKYITARLRASIKYADRVVTISEYSRQDIQRRIPGCENKIQVIYNGLNPIAEDVLKDNRGRQQSWEKQGAGREYFAAVTSGLPHKNAAGILAAYSSYFGMTREPLDLVVVGIDQERIKELEPQIARHITCYPYIKNNREFHRIIQKSQAFLFLSLIEGFGFPPLEAMQLGVPVICSNRTSLPEVAEGAALLVDPENSREIAENMIKIAESEELRIQLREAGLLNTQRFRWEEQARKYWKEFAR